MRFQLGANTTDDGTLQRREIQNTCTNIYTNGTFIKMQLRLSAAKNHHISQYLGTCISYHIRIETSL